MGKKLLAVSITVWSIIYITHLLDYLPFVNIMISPPQHQAIFLGAILVLTFCAFPAKSGSNRVRWYDYILMLMSIAPNAYVVFYYDLWQAHAGSHCTTQETILFISLFVALLEGLRRVLGIIIPILTLCFAVHPLVSNHLPGVLFGRGYALDRITTQFFLPSDGIYSLPLNISATIVIAFLTFGQFLVAAGGGNVLMALGLLLVGRVRGGAAKAAVIASGMFGTLSGSPTSNVATSGTFTIPMMKSTGYSSEFAAGVEAAASNGGQLMPPVMGVVAFMMAEMLGMPYSRVCYVAFMPAVIYYLIMFLQVDFHAARKGLKGYGQSDIGKLKRTLKTGWVHLLPVGVLIYFLFGVKYAPELSAIFATGSLVIIATLSNRREFRLNTVVDALASSARTCVIVALACAMAGLMMGSVSLTGVAVSISGDLVRVSGDSMFTLLILAGITCFIFGMGMGSIPCYIFVSLMVAPALEQMGVPVIIAHLFVFWMAMASFITPPVCIAAFVSSAIAQCSPMRAGVSAIRVGIGILVLPYAFVYNPGLVLLGTPFEIVIAIFSAVLGSLFIAAGLEGYFLKVASNWERILFVIAGFSMLVPSFTVRLFGFVVVATPIILQVVRSRVKSRVLAGGLSQFE